jgi:hypothetical protein
MAAACFLCSGFHASCLAFVFTAHTKKPFLSTGISAQQKASFFLAADSVAWGADRVRVCLSSVAEQLFLHTHIPQPHRSCTENFGMQETLVQCSFWIWIQLSRFYYWYYVLHVSAPDQHRLAKRVLVLLLFWIQLIQSTFYYCNATSCMLLPVASHRSHTVMSKFY